MTSSAVDGLQQTEKARNEHLRRAAIRAINDPVELARAARIIKAAIGRKVLTADDLRGPIIKPEPAELGGDGHDTAA